MKTIIILTDMPDGSVDIQYMTQMTTEEALAGLKPQQSRAYQTAQLFSGVVTNAAALAAEMRVMHAAMVENAHATESAKCLR